MSESKPAGVACVLVLDRFQAGILERAVRLARMLDVPDRGEPLAEAASAYWKARTEVLDRVVELLEKGRQS